MKKNWFCLVTFLAFALLTAVSCKPKEVRVQTEAASALGSVLATEVKRAIGATKSVVIFTQNRGKEVTSSAEAEFLKDLKSSDVTVLASITPNLGDPMNYDDFGLSAADFSNALEKFPEAGAIVSFIGVPHLRPTQFASLPVTHPPVFIVAVTSLGGASGVVGGKNILPQLRAAKIVQLAIVDGDGTPVATGDQSNKLFNQHYNILRAGP